MGLHRNCDKRCDDRKHCKKKCAKPKSITQKMVGTTGLVIDKPGVYQFCENITFSPSNTLCLLYTSPSPRD